MKLRDWYNFNFGNEQFNCNIGEVTSHKLDGEILNCNADDGGYINKDGGNYISYESVEGAKEGDKIVTYFIYNPFTNVQDDVMTRMDFIIDDNEI